MGMSGSGDFVGSFEWYLKEEGGDSYPHQFDT